MSRHRDIERIPLLTALGRDLGREVASGSTVREWAAGAALWEAGDAATGLHFLLAGSVRIVREDADRQLLVHVVDAIGEPFGEVPLFSGGGYPARAVAAEATRCLVVPERTLRGAMAAEPDLARALLAGLARRVEHLVGRLGRLAVASVRDRLRARLAAEAEIVGDRLIVRYGSHARLAEEVGTVREVVSREIARLRDAGTVGSAGRGRLRVLDPRGLRDDEHGER